MPTHEYTKFDELVSPSIPKSPEQAKPFKKFVGNQVFSLLKDDTEINAFVEQAISLSGVNPGRRIISENYGIELIKNFKSESKGTGSRAVAISLYYLLLKTPDTTDRRYSDCARAITEFLFDENTEFEKKFELRLTSLNANQTKDYPTSWANLLEERAQFSDIEISIGSEKAGFQIADIQQFEPFFEKAIELGEPFRFRISPAIVGDGMALQICEGKTYPLRFSRSRFVFPASTEPLIFPSQNEPHTNRFLCEATDTKPIQFVFLIGSRQLKKAIFEFAQSTPIAREISVQKLDRFSQQCEKLEGLLWVRRINISFFLPDLSC